MYIASSSHFIINDYFYLLLLATAKTSTFEIAGASLGTFLLLLILGGLSGFALYIYKHCFSRKRGEAGITKHNPTVFIHIYHCV